LLRGLAQVSMNWRSLGCRSCVLYSTPRPHCSVHKASCGCLSCLNCKSSLLCIEGAWGSVLAFCTPLQVFIALCTEEQWFLIGTGKTESRRASRVFWHAPKSISKVWYSVQNSASYKRAALLTSCALCHCSSLCAASLQPHAIAATSLEKPCIEVACAPTFNQHHRLACFHSQTLTNGCPNPFCSVICRSVLEDTAGLMVLSW